MPQLRKIAIATVLTVSLVTPIAFAQDQRPPPPCTADGASDFDFWLGEWEAFDSNDGSLQGREHITKDLDNCVLTQHWEQQNDRFKHPGADERMRGTSLTARNGNSADAKWWQTWVDSVGSYIVVSGQLRDGVMVLEGVPTNAPYKRKWHWQPLEDGSVHSWGTASGDGGRNWQTTWDITYRRPASGDASK